MSDLLTHWAVFEDCRRLAPLAHEIEPCFKELIEKESDYARLGAITRGANRFMADVLKQARDHWEEDGHPNLGRKVAFVLGGLTHQACDRLMKPLLRADPDQKREISAYYDTHVFRQVYLSGREEPFNRFLLEDNSTDAGQALEAFVRSLFQRALLSSHTLKPDHHDIDGWLDALFAMVQDLYIDVNLYVSVFQQPDPATMERYGVKTVFYRADDPAIQLARGLQRGEPSNTEASRQALTIEANKSHYAQALALSMIYLRDASSFWRGESDVLTSPNVEAGLLQETK